MFEDNLAENDNDEEDGAITARDIQEYKVEKGEATSDIKEKSEIKEASPSTSSN